ncbi:MAG: hypothetical protein ACRD2L_05540, partial [Terriglobia bacterium]
QTTARDFMPFRTAVIDGSEGVSKVAESDFFKNEKRLLVLVPYLGACHDLMNALSNRGISKPVISCSLGSGQPELIQLLRVFPHWEKALVFENSAASEWSEFDAKWHHVLVDRICWHLEEFSAREGRSFVLCHCETPENVRFSWPEVAEIPDGTTETGVPGERVISEGWKEQSFKVEELNWHRERKRALINAPHAVAAFLCYRLLAIREMDAEKQYLAPLQQMLLSEHPEWREGMDHYLRLRAIEVARNRQRPEVSDVEKLHADYLEAYRMAKEAQERFFATNDRLDRLMSPSNLSKELEKFEEHILKPIAFYEQEGTSLTKKWIYGRPNHVDIADLRKFLTETFLKATQWLMSRR